MNVSNAEKVLRHIRNNTQAAIDANTLNNYCATFSLLLLTATPPVNLVFYERSNKHNISFENLP
jgi:hypothetical protein